MHEFARNSVGQKNVERNSNLGVRHAVINHVIERVKQVKQEGMFATEGFRYVLCTTFCVDVLNAIRDQYQAERELQRIRYEHINLLLLLKRETGTLSAEDLLEVGAWLTPAAAQ